MLEKHFNYLAVSIIASKYSKRFGENLLKQYYVHDVVLS